MALKIRWTIRLGAAVGLLLATLPAAATAQVIPPPPPCPIPCPLPEGPIAVEDYRVETTIVDQVAVTRVTEILRNDGEQAAETEFLHPLPPGAVVTDLTLWIDGEPIAGEVMDAGEARRTYEGIVARMRDPALLEFADHGLVRASVFPIPPDGERRIELEYSQVLESDQGLIRYRHPLGTELGGRTTPERLTATIEITSSAGLKTIYSPTHDMDIHREGPDRALVGYETAGEIPDGDLALYYSTSSDRIDLDVLSFRDPEDGAAGFFLLLASPGDLGDAEAAVAKDVILVIDRSGSMEGDKLRQAQDAAGYVLDNLNESDRFAVIAFSTGVEAFADRLRPADEAPDAERWVERLGAAGSTDIGSALETAFRTAGVERPTYVLFLTDGLPTEGEIHTDEILADAADAAPDNVSVFAFGVGYDVDTVLLDELADQHHGKTTYVTPDEGVDEAVTALYAKVSSPVLTDLSLDFGDITVFDLYPDPLPDLFGGEQLVVVGRYREGGTTDLVLTGEVEDSRERFRFDDRTFDASGGVEEIPRLWATRKIGHLLRQVRIDGPDEETIDQIVDLSIRYGIVTPYTSYLVTEPAPFGDAEAERIAADAYETAASTTVAASGEEAVAAAEAAGELADTDIAPDTVEASEGRVQIAGSRTLVWSGDAWVDTAFDPDRMEPLEVPFLSSDYFELAAADPDLSEALAVADRVIVVWRGTAYEVVDSGDPGDPIDTDPAWSITTTGTAGSGVAGPVSQGADGGGLVLWLIAGGAAVLAVGIPTAVVARKRRGRPTAEPPVSS